MFCSQNSLQSFFIVEWINEKCSFLIDYSGNVVVVFSLDIEERIALLREQNGMRFQIFNV